MAPLPPDRKQMSIGTMISMRDLGSVYPHFAEDREALGNVTVWTLEKGVPRKAQL